MAAWHEPPRESSGMAVRVAFLLLIVALFGLAVLIGATMILDAMSAWPK